MKKHEVRGWIEETGIIASVRVYSPEDDFSPRKLSSRAEFPSSKLPSLSLSRLKSFRIWLGSIPMQSWGPAA
jgi:hypothetical protein